jgi:dTDP-4-dehydrorhamnose reductase
MSRPECAIGRRPVLVAGSNGRLGLAFVSRAAEPAAVDVGKLDGTDVPAIRRVVADLQPGPILNYSVFNDEHGAKSGVGVGSREWYKEV